METTKQPMTKKQIDRAREISILLASQVPGITVHDLFLAAEYMATLHGMERE